MSTLPSLARRGVTAALAIAAILLLVDSAPAAGSHAAVARNTGVTRAPSHPDAPGLGRRCDPPPCPRAGSARM
jgi:hypothetical protein